MLVTLLLIVLFCVGSRGVTLLAIQQRLGFHSEHTIVCYVGSSLDVSDYRGVLTLVTCRSWQRYREGASVSETFLFETALLSSFPNYIPH
jgi:hypothetical protein